jgi:hypothetical protein
VSIGVVRRDEKDELTRGGRFALGNEMTGEPIARGKSLRGAVTDRAEDALEADAGLAELAMMSEDALREGAGVFVPLLEENGEVAGVGGEVGGKAGTCFDDEQGEGAAR